MKKSVAGIGVAFVAVAAIGIVTASTQNNRESAERSGGSAHLADSSGDKSTPAPDGMNTQSDPAATNQIIISDFAFTPKTIKVSRGTTVTWTNQDAAKHDITPDRESEDFKASKLLAKGESYSFTFNAAGTYGYYCSPHPYMKATVVVE